jgi:2-oxoglutarate dehydrogenase E2 component (dihydrolipoamide succinyltransferase)
MAVEIVVPPLGESIVEATVGRWLKKEGDTVTKGELIAELETDKVNMDVNAEESGVLVSIKHPEGDTVGINEVLAVLEPKLRRPHSASRRKTGSTPQISKAAAQAARS